MKIRRGAFPRVAANYIVRSRGRNAGNPFVEALRSLEPEGALLDRFSISPAAPTRSDRAESASYRRENLPSIKDFVYPRPQYERAGQHFMRALYESYHPKSPLDLVATQHRAAIALANSIDGLKIARGWSSAEGVGLFGQTGSGKSTFLDVICDPFLVVIEHTNYRGVPLACVQIPVLPVHAPQDGTFKAFMYQFFDAVDSALGIVLYGPQARRLKSIAEATLLIGKVISATNIGVIVFEDLQNLRAAKNAKYVEQLLNMFSEIIEVFGCSMVVSGTPAVTDLVVDNVRNIRKIVDGGDSRLGHMPWGGLELKDFQDDLWQHTWLKKKALLTPEIRRAWWECSGGNPSFQRMVFGFAQNMEIERNEILSVESFRNCYVHDMALLNPAIEALVSGREDRIRQFDDLMFEEDYAKLAGTCRSPRASTGEEFSELGLRPVEEIERKKRNAPAHNNGPSPPRYVRSDALPLTDPRSLA